MKNSNITWKDIDNELKKRGTSLKKLLKNRKEPLLPKCACGKKSVRLAWRWNDPKRRYQSGYKLIHTGYMFICIKCIKNKLK